MPSKSKQQQKFMGIVRAIQKGDQPASKFSKKAQDAADDMKKKDVEDFASTKHKGLPKKVEQALREKIRTMVEDYVESCGYVVSAKDPNYKLKSPGGTGEEDKELKEEGFGSDEFLTKTEKKKFEKERLENAEVLGYTLTGTKDLKESVNESMELKKLEDAIKMFQKKIKKQGRITNARDADHLKSLIKIYKQMGGRKVKESVNESKKEKDQIIRYLQGLGFNERTAKKAVAKSYNYISKAYRNTGTQYKGDLIANILTKKESVFAVRQDKIKNGERFPKKPNFDYDPEKGKSRIKKVNESMSPSQIKKMRDEFEKTGDLPPHLKKFALDLKILKKKHKVKNIVVPGLEWMSDMKEVNEGKGVEKVLKMANDHSFGKLGGRTVDALSAGLFKGVYDKASQNAKDKINKMNEKQLYVFMTKLWSKFGKQVKIS